MSWLALTPEQLAAAESKIPPPRKKRAPLTPGRVVYLLFHYPRQLWKDGWRWHYEASRGRRGMAETLSRTAPEPELSGEPVELNYLTGQRYAALTSVAILSAQRTFGRAIAPVLHDDGSLRPEDITLFKFHFPHCRVVMASEILERLETFLPQARFPFLRKIRLGYIHLRKLTDIHLGCTGPRVVLDSDVFFLKRPEQVLSAIREQKAFFLQDCMTSYGATPEALSELAACRVPDRANVGLYQLSSDKIDWEFVEHSSRKLIDRFGFSYYLEQALTAMLLAKNGAQALGNEYVVYPEPERARLGSDVAYHYVDRSYLLLYRYGWRQVFELPSNTHA